MDDSLGDVGEIKQAVLHWKALIKILKSADFTLRKYQVNLTELPKKYEILRLIKYKKFIDSRYFHGSTHHTAGNTSYFYKTTHDITHVLNPLDLVSPTKITKKKS